MLKVTDFSELSIPKLSPIKSHTHSKIFRRNIFREIIGIQEVSKQKKSFWNSLLQFRLSRKQEFRHTQIESPPKINTTFLCWVYIKFPRHHIFEKDKCKENSDFYQNSTFVLYFKKTCKLKNSLTCYFPKLALCVVFRFLCVRLVS